MKLNPVQLFALTFASVFNKSLSGVKASFGKIKNAATNRKGQFQGVDSLIPLALSLVLLAVVVGVGALILNEMNDQVSDNNTTDVLNKGTSAMNDIAGWFSTIVVIAVAAIIFLLLGFVRRAGKAGGTA